MQIIEHFIQGKRNNAQLCEDGWVVTPHFAAVVDGSTSKVAGRNGGRMAMELVCKALHTLPPLVDKATMLHHLTAVLAAHNVSQAATKAEYRLTCSAVIYSAARRVVWQVGDCLCRFGGTTYTHNKLVDTILTDARCHAVQYLLAHGHTAADIMANDLGRAIIFDALREQTNFQNDPNPYNPYRYPVFDGTPVDNALVPELPVPRGVGEVVLASDGYPMLFDTWQPTEAYLQQVLQSDPLCIAANAATKCLMAGNVSFDDRCYLHIATN